jgi:hypothetical protein
MSIGFNSDRNIFTIVSALKDKYTYVLMIIPVLLIYLISKNIFFMLIFVFLDVWKTLLEKISGFPIPLYFLDYGIIMCSYLISPVHGIILIFIMFALRIAFSDFKPRHLIKLPILLMIAFLSHLMNPLPLTLVGPCLFLSRYVVEYMLSAIGMTPVSSNLPERILNIIITIIFFSTVGQGFIALFQI